MPQSKKQTEHRFLWNDSRSMTDADFFTLGYTGRQIQEIVDALLSAGVRTLLDIRANPVSMWRPELHKTNLKALIESKDVNYFHYPKLGVPRDVRVKAINEGRRHEIWDWYDQYVIPVYIGSNLHHFLNSVEHPVAMMCVEADPQECHRHRLFMALEEMGLRGYEL